MNQFWKLFIHPKVAADEVTYLKSKGLVGLLLLHIPITIFNAFYFGDYGSLIFYNNTIGIFSGIIAMIIIRKRGEFVTASLLFSMVALMNISASLWVTGGIHSVDIFWYMILGVSLSLFVSRVAGVLISTLSMTSLTVYYIMEKNGVKDFLAVRLEHDITEDYINVMIIFFFSTIIHYFFASSDKLRRSKEDETIEKANVLEINYQFLANNVKEVIAVHKEDGEIAYVSPYIETLLGYKAEELIGKKYQTLFVEEGGNLVFDKNKETRNKVRTSTKFEEELWLEIVVVPVLDSNGVFDRFISTMRDVTSEIQENLKLKKVRKQIARDFHDEMGNKLAAITLNSNVLKNRIGEDSVAILEVVAKIEKNSKSLYQNSRDFIWSIDSKSDELVELFTYLRDFAEDLLYTDDMQFFVEKGNVPDHQLPLSYSRHIVLMFKEAITNAYKYSKASQVKLCFGVENQVLTVSLRDNGIGFDENTVKKGNGLLNLQNRANRIGATLSIESAEGKGTLVKLDLSLTD